MSWRRDKTLSNETYTSATEYYSALRKGFREKADHNKMESQWCFSLTIAFTLAAPLFVTLGQGVLLAKIVPATLSVLAAGLTAWLQLRKPQRLWSIYRRAQRELEREKSYFDFKLSEYATSNEPEKMLAQRVSDIAFTVHEQWEGLVPESDALVSNRAANSLRITNEQD